MWRVWVSSIEALFFPNSWAFFACASQYPLFNKFSPRKKAVIFYFYTNIISFMAYVVQLQAGKWHSNAARCSMEFDGKPRNNKKEETMRVEKYILARIHAFVICLLLLLRNVRSLFNFNAAPAILPLLMINLLRPNSVRHSHNSNGMYFNTINSTTERIWVILAIR